VYSSPKQENFGFSLLPKSLQRRPRVDFNVLTNLTPAGKQLSIPSAAQPAYYVIEPGLNRDVGVGREHGLKSPPVEKLQAVLQLALRESGYLPSDEQHRPSLMIFFHWGTSSYNPGAGEGEMQGRRALMDRAMLIGGEKLAKRISEAMQQIDQVETAMRMQSSPLNWLRTAEMPGIMPVQFDPLELLMRESPEMSRMVEELFSSSYYVVASAFDYAAMAENRPVLLWRTKMTVNSIGVNMVESVPPLIASAAPYFGRDMETPMLVSRRISRDGKVEIGEARVVEEDVKDLQPKPADKNGKK
jgi:hypothetical protein